MRTKKPLSHLSSEHFRLARALTPQDLFNLDRLSPTELTGVGDDDIVEMATLFWYDLARLEKPGMVRIASFGSRVLCAAYALGRFNLDGRQIERPANER